MFKSSGRQISNVVSVPAPVGGLNAVDPIAAMPETDAIIMENFFPTPFSVNSRNGAKNHVTGITGNVYTLLPYRAGAINKLFAAVDNSGTCSIYDCTNAGTVGAAVVSGLTSAKCQYVNFSTSAGNYLYVFNGVDNPRLYDGTTWTTITNISTPAITGVTTSTLKNPEVYKNRLFFCQLNTSTVWYLPVISIGGAANPLYLGSYLKHGGNILRVINVSIATANMINDYIGFLSSEGELLVFTGSDPASDFSLVGSYRTGRPLGDRTTIKYGSDVLINSTSGLFGLSQLYDSSNDNPRGAITYKISPLFNQAAQSYYNNFGWQVILYSYGTKIILNIPTGDSDVAFQYVMNTLTGAWCKFTGWKAYCFETLNNNLYYGSSGYIAQADTDNSDFGQNITAQLKPSFNYFGIKYNKKFELIRPVVSSDIISSYNLTMNYDFQNFSSFAAIPLSTSANIWNAVWDTTWSGTDTIQQLWKSITGIGYCASPRIDYKFNSGSFKIQAFDYVYQLGGIL